MKALGAYIFAGGFTVGVSRHFKVVGHLEGNDYGVETARLNFPKMPIRYGKEKWQVDDPNFSELDFLYANPPCAIFSPMGIVTTKGAGSWKDDPRLECWKNAVELVDVLKPRAFALESVCQAYTRGRGLVDEFTRVALERGYSVTHLLVDAKWTGIPQSRKRFFIVFHKQPRLLGYQFNYAPPPTVGEVLATIDDPGHRTITTSRKDWYDLVARTPQGDRVVHTWQKDHPGYETRLNAQGKVAGRPSFQDRRLSADEVMGAWVGDKFYHPTEPRHIGLNEAKAICGYPDDFQIAPKDLRGFGSLLARAVMPPVGEWLARVIKTTLSSKTTGERTVMRIDTREPNIAPVDLTDQYLDRKTGRVIEYLDGGLTNDVRAVEDEEELSEVTDGLDEELAPATSASPLHEPRKPGPTVPRVGRSHVERQSAAPAGPEVSNGPVTTVHRSGSITTDPENPVYDDVEKITGVPKEMVGRIAVALSYTDIISVIATMTGTEEALVQRAIAAINMIRLLSSPAGRPVAPPAAHPSEEPVEPSDPMDHAVVERRSQPADEKRPGGGTSRKRAVTPPVSYVPGDDDPKPKENEGSGVFIRRMLMADTHTPEQIVRLVLASYAGRKTTAKDVAWNHQWLKNHGIEPPAWRGKSKPGSYPGARSPAVARPGPAEPAVPKPPSPVAAGSVSARVLSGPLRRVAVVDWFPRVCGATDFAGHLRSGFKGLELISATRSGNPVKGWQTPWGWRCLKASDAAAELNGYDAVLMTDIACLSPNATEKGGLPWYADVLAKITVPLTAVFHGGMTYKRDYDPVINALFTAPGFTGSIMTVRGRQARERLSPNWPNLRLVVNPYLPYDPDRALGTKPKRRTHEVMMSARLASNKGQNALVAALKDLRYDAHIWGENPYGLPSIAWRLHELGEALGYRADHPPKLRRDHGDLTHPNAPKFYTGQFGFTVGRGAPKRHLRYHDGYSKLSEVDWSPWLHLTAYTPQFGGLLEYTILDAIHAGAVALVPGSVIADGSVTYGSLEYYDFNGCTLWSDEKGGVKGQGETDVRELAKAVNALLDKPDRALAAIAQKQYAEIREKHDAAGTWKSIVKAFKGEGK